MYSVRFFVGFLGAAAAAPLVGFLHERTGSLNAAIVVLAGFALVTLACALFFPDRREELRPELWSAVPAPGRVAPGRRLFTFAKRAFKCAGNAALSPAAAIFS